MSEAGPTGIVPPNFRTPRLIGIFNVVFGSEILLCAMFFAGYTLTLPLWARLFESVQKQAERQGEAARKAQVDAAVEQEKAAKTEQEKIQATARRMELESRPKTTIPGTMDFNRMGFGDPGFVAFSWTEVITSIVLNIMMLASGIGLLHWRPWARSLAVWTAALKIARLVVVWGYFIAAIVPQFSRKLGEVVSEMMTMQQPGLKMPGGVPPAAFFAKVYAIMYGGMAAGFIVFGVIYPAIVLWVLTRPGAISACSGRWKLPKEPKQPW
jgi:hypothetical protein